MLVYAFWHWPQPPAAQEDYVAALLAFQAALSDHAPAGFLGSVVFQTGPAPWIGAPGGGYLDWYVLADSAALDGVNAAAVSPACRSAHDRVAALAAGGTAGLYQPWAGEADARRASLATWLAKPAGMTYGEMRELLRQWTARPGSSAWGRYMSLGPAPEFCMLSQEPGGQTAITAVLETTLRPLWPAS